MIKTYLAFDVGTKHTGIAIANSLTLQASGISTIINHKNGAINWNAIDKIVNAYDICTFIVGLPIYAEKKPQNMNFVVKSFAKKLNKRYHINVEFIDEHLSSNEAKKQLKYNHYHRNAKRTNIDKLSSQLILQTWLNEKEPNKQ